MVRAGAALPGRAGEAVRDLRRPGFPPDAMPLPDDMPADRPGRYPLGLRPMTAGSVRDHERPVPVPRYEVRPGWYSAMAQSRAVSVVLRGYGTTDEPSCPDTGEGLVEVMLRSPAAGGCSDDDQLGWPLLDERPSEPVSHLLNGAVFAHFGLCELSRHQGVAVHQHAADRLRDSLAEFDLGYWTRYDLRHRAPASLAYHCLHSALLTAAGRVLADPRWPAVATAGDRYTRNPAGRLRAAAGKGWFVLRERRAGS
ncbi:D-glucuronyl C5-epimerase family protein [Streptomyces sp. NY05-11A]|uniref:D-glucuronyl C5-epimerase family protein n=1 Tax=Streptomyces soliscabiei TaxID=588897 RepID=UPI0029B35EB3|nr:D-glucuronyl C5-epimerase family protein [Streptomyces sp. NY05-11A]MDX2678761.1 D-glucuronyl C5-epimerase family protein [Streptomyces sp. NY05-11A]